MAGLKSDSPERGQVLAAVGPVDFFGNAQSLVTDIGAFQYNAASTSDTRVLDPSPANPDYWAVFGGSAAITITPASQSFGSIPVGTTADRTFTVQNSGSGTLSGSASVAAPFSIFSGGSYNLGAGLSQVLTVKYSPTTAGSDTANVTFTGGNGATAGVSGSATAPLLLDSLTFQALAGSISSPFIVTSGYIYEPAETDLTSGGLAVYSLTVTNAGSSVIEALVNAPTIGANSFYVNIDALPQDATIIWGVTVTTGFGQRTVGWRGNGSDSNNQFVRKIFELAAGTHQLIFVGREADTQLEQLSIRSVPQPPQNFRLVVVQ